MPMSSGGNCINYEKQELDKIQTEAAMIVVWASKHVSLHALNEEVNFDPLETRHRKHRLSLLYKIFNNLSPEYLSSLIPHTVNTLSKKNLSNAQNSRTVDSRTSQYFNFSSPSAIREWTNLPFDVRNSDSVIIFKRKLNSDMKATPRFFL